MREGGKKTERGEGKEEGEGGERKTDRRCFESLTVLIQNIRFSSIKDSFRILQYSHYPLGGATRPFRNE